MGDITLSEEQFKELLRQAAAEAAEEAVQHVQQVQNSSHLINQLGGAPRVSIENWRRDQMAWDRLSAAEKEQALINQGRAFQAMEDREPILAAKDIVARARKVGEKVAPEILELARRNVTEFDTAHIEILADETHIGDGRRAGKGARLMCHPKFAEILVDMGHARLINPEDTEAIDAQNPADAVVTPLKRVAGA